MTSSLSTHVLDTALGRPVRGVRVSLYRGTDLLARSDTDGDGRITELAAGLAAGSYRLMFDVKGPFFEEVALQVRLEDGHYHIPLLVTPFGCVTYRGS
jgi:5-hydroxyisourate hydrolase